MKFRKGRLRFSEQELLKNLNVYTGHKDELAPLAENEFEQFYEISNTQHPVPEHLKKAAQLLDQEDF